MMAEPRYSDERQQSALKTAADAKPSAISQSFGAADRRWMPTLDDAVIKPGGIHGIPFGGYATRREAIAAAKAVRESCRQEMAETNGSM